MPDSNDPKTFDVTGPRRGVPPPTSRPVILGRSGTAGDPMVRGQPSSPEPPPLSPPMPVGTPPPAEAKEPLFQSPTPLPSTPMFGSPEPLPPTQPLGPPPGLANTSAAAGPAPAIGNSTIIADEPIPVVPAPPVEATADDELPAAPASPALQALPPEPKLKPIKRVHHFPWDLLIFFLVILIAVYLAIDAGLINTSLKLPFHVFKQSS